MTIKKFDSNFDIALWIIFIALGIASWFLCKNLSAPEYERVDNPIVKAYTYTDDDGDVVESQYEAVWHHKNFSSPSIVLYDGSRDKAFEIKDEYLPEYESLMPESRYGAFFYRWFWVMFALFVIVAGLVVYYVGGALRDTILYNKIKSNPTFADVAYFLYTDRVCKRDDARALIPATIDSYIKNQIPQLAKKYPQSFVNLVISLLCEIKRQNDTKIKFFLQYLENTKDQLEYLKVLSAYWASPERTHPDAAKYRERVDFLRQKKYIKIESTVTPQEVAEIVTRQLNKLFTDIMGSEVFSFQAYESEMMETWKVNGSIFVKVETENTPRTFTWSGEGYKDIEFPGIDIRVTIYHYVQKEKKILWNKLLEPKCTYEAETLKISDLYDNMIKKTLESFDEELKK